MSQLIPVQTNDRQDIECYLATNDFKEFFIRVSKAKTMFSAEELRMLEHEISKPQYYLRFGAEAIAYLKDTLTAERLLPINAAPRKTDEKKMRQFIVNHFPQLFPSLDFLGTEVPGHNGRVDLLAKDREENRMVIFELKTGSGDPTRQLLAYAMDYINPILVGVTESPIVHKQGILYYTMSELEELLK